MFRPALALDDAQHRDHQQVAGGEGVAVEPRLVAEPIGQVLEPLVDARLDRRPAHLRPRLVGLEDGHEREVHDRRLDRVERGEHPFDRARPRRRIARQQAAETLGDVEHDRARFEQRDVAVLLGRHLAERLARAVRRLLLLALGEIVDVVGLADFLERPAHAQIADLAPREGGTQS